MGARCGRALRSAAKLSNLLAGAQASSQPASRISALQPPVQPHVAPHVLQRSLRAPPPAIGPSFSLRRWTSAASWQEAIARTKKADHGIYLAERIEGPKRNRPQRAFPPSLAPEILSSVPILVAARVVSEVEPLHRGPAAVELAACCLITDAELELTAILEPGLAPRVEDAVSFESAIAELRRFVAARSAPGSPALLVGRGLCQLPSSSSRDSEKGSVLLSELLGAEAVRRRLPAFPDALVLDLDCLSRALLGRTLEPSSGGALERAAEETRQMKELLTCLAELEVEPAALHRVRVPGMPRTLREALGGGGGETGLAGAAGTGLAGVAEDGFKAGASALFAPVDAPLAWEASPALGREGPAWPPWPELRTVVQTRGRESALSEAVESLAGAGSKKALRELRAAGVDSLLALVRQFPATWVGAEGHGAFDPGLSEAQKVVVPVRYLSSSISLWRSRRGFLESLWAVEEAEGAEEGRAEDVDGLEERPTDLGQSTRHVIHLTRWAAGPTAAFALERTRKEYEYNFRRGPALLVGKIKPRRARPEPLEPAQFNSAFSSAWEGAFGDCVVKRPEEVDAGAGLGRVSPTYRAVGGASPRVVGPLVAAALRRLEEGAARGRWRDPLPAAARRRLGLCGLAQALAAQHRPCEEWVLAEGKRRLAFQDLFALQLRLLLRRGGGGQGDGTGQGEGRGAETELRGWALESEKLGRAGVLDLDRDSVSAAELVRRIRACEDEEACARMESSDSVTIPSQPAPISLLSLALDCLPYSPTLGQASTLQRLLLRMWGSPPASPPMHCLLQGDVGCGKTVVAFLAMLSAADRGFQAALMAPTEVLAEQHDRALSALLARMRLRALAARPAMLTRLPQSALLTGSARGAKRTALDAALAEGRVALVMGTHALSSPSTRWRRLGLAVVDEQHRFGVAQRGRLVGNALEGKGEMEDDGDAGDDGSDTDADTGDLKVQQANLQAAPPHVLSMTATPIPRSLALLRHGQLDHAAIRDLPPGRIPVATRLVLEGEGVEEERGVAAAAPGPGLGARRAEMERHVRSELEQGGRVYVVCPLVEPSEAETMAGVRSAVEEHARWVELLCGGGEQDEENEQLRASTKPLQPHQIGLLHGRQHSTDKDATLRAFAAGEVRLLVATTVVEVGVDVPEASLLVVESAERFGLAQLHQLRGRVGRGHRPSTAYFASRSGAAAPRLRALARTTDGFRVAALDLEARGAGEVFGYAQSGTSTRARRGCQAELPRDAALVAPAREAALRLARTLPLEEWSPELCALVAGDELEHLDLFHVGGGGGVP